jgi:hypothetical protein
LARDGEEGQMMLLAAVVMVLGLAALGGLVARVGQLPPQITRDQADPIFLEVQPLSALLEALAAPTGVQARGSLPMPDTVDYDNAFTAALRHLKALEAAKGYHLDWVFCTSGGADYVSVELSHAQAVLGFRTAVPGLMAPATPC